MTGRLPQRGAKTVALYTHCNKDGTDISVGEKLLYKSRREQEKQTWQAFFGFFNYEKEGPGVRKDAPEKNAFVSFFDIFFGNFWRLIPVNLFYVLLSLPLLTGGLSTVGITHVTRALARRKHSFGISDCTEIVRKNWKQALGMGVLRLFCFSVLGFAVWFYAFREEGMLGTIGTGICLFLAIVLSMMDLYVWTLMITFRFTMKQLCKNSFRFVFLNFWRNLLCLVLLLPAGALFIVIPFLFPHPFVIFLTAVIYVCVFPGFRFLLTQFCTFPAIKKFIIDPYYAAHPDADIELRRNLGVYVERSDEEETADANDEEDPNAPIFRDR